MVLDKKELFFHKYVFWLFLFLVWQGDIAYWILFFYKIVDRFRKTVRHFTYKIG